MTSEERSAGSGDERAGHEVLEPRPMPGVAFALGGAVAAAYVALSIADGGFEEAVWAQATILVWWTVVVAFLARAWPQSRIPVAASISGLCLFGIGVLSGISIEWTSDGGAALGDAVRGAGYLGVFVLGAIAARAGAGGSLLAGVAVGLFGLAVIALLSRLEPGFVTDPDEARGLEVSGGRLSYPLGYWNALGACMAIAIPLLVWLARSARSALWRAAAAAAVPTCSLTLFFSGSRGAGLALAVAIVVLLVAGPRRVTLLALAAISLGASLPLGRFAERTPELIDGSSAPVAASAGDEVLLLTIGMSLVAGVLVLLLDRRIAAARLPRAVVRGGAVAIAVLVAIGIVVADPIEGIRSLDDPPAPTGDSGTRFANVGGSGRVQFWEAALDAFYEEPVRGIGAGAYESYWAQNGTLEFNVEHAHSLPLESAAELGLVGGVLAIGFFLPPLVSGVRRLRGPGGRLDGDASGGAVGAALAVLAAGAVTAAIEWTWDIPAAFVPVVAAAALVCVPAFGRARVAVGAGRRELSSRRLLAGRLAVGISGVAAVVASGALLLSELAIERSRSAVREGRLADAVDEARAASATVPFASDPYTQLALVQQRRGRREPALRAIDQAQDRASEDWALWFVEAGIELTSDETGRGVWALNRAAALNPKAPPDLLRAPSALPAGAADERIRGLLDE